MILLIAKSSWRIAELREQGYDVGRLLGPRDRKTDVDGFPWAADNQAFSGFDEDGYVSMLRAITGVPGCLFVTVPDVVGDRDATLRLYDRWAPRLRALDLPRAYVLQDGEDGSTIPEDAQAAFVGGSTEYKLGRQAERACSVARDRGLWLHMGRVNTLRRIRYAHSIGVDSIDGSKWSRFLDAWKHQLGALDQTALRFVRQEEETA